MRLSEIKPERGSLEDLVIWGVEPILKLIDLQARKIEEDLEKDDVEALTFFTDEIKGKLVDLKEAIYRWERPSRTTPPG